MFSGRFCRNEPRALGIGGLAMCARKASPWHHFTGVVDLISISILGEKESTTYIWQKARGEMPVEKAAAEGNPMTYSICSGRGSNACRAIGVISV